MDLKSYREWVEVIWNLFEAGLIDHDEYRRTIRSLQKPEELTQAS